MSPDGIGTTQLKATIKKAKEFFSTFLNSTLSQQAKWKAVTTAVEPALLYPLVNTFFSLREFSPLDSITLQMKCISLRLNRHFPRAILHGLCSLGELGVPSSSQKTTKDRLNYFLVNIRQ
jgi:hypothetical protein